MPMRAQVSLLERQGLTTRKPPQRACQRDPEAIERWRLEAYPAIARQANAFDGKNFLE